VKSLIALCLLVGAAVSGIRPPVRILVFYDMEGASGVLSDATMDEAKPDSFAVGQASLIDDVNAVVAGLFDGGATLVDVQTAHGGGGDSLVPRDRLDPRAGILAGPRKLPLYVLGRPDHMAPDQVIPHPEYDAIVTVAMHDKPMSGGFSPHTIGAGISPIIDGRAVTETELVGYAYGTEGIPVIFSSGDDRLRATLAGVMPWVEYAVVKRITTPTVPEALPRQQVQGDLREAAARAVRGLADAGPMKVMRLTPPIRAGLLPSYPLFLPPGIPNIPGVEKRGDTVTFMAKNYREAYWGMFVLQRIARAFAYEQALLDAGRDDPGLLRRVRDPRWGKWGEFEAGRWKP
jgi:D-amino peptidase